MNQRGMNPQPPPIEVALEVRDLRKSFGDHVAVDGVSFRLARGGSLGLVGESGSGKTTLARILVGLEQADSGSIQVGGTRTGVTASSGRPGRVARHNRARDIQMVFQDPYLSLDPRITVSGCLDEVLRLHGGRSLASRKRRIAELLDQVGLGQRESQALPRDLSGGQRQRAAIARALAAEPRLLILDEAVAALDVSIQSQVLNLLADIRAATGVSFLFVSHDLAVVRYVTDDVVVLYRGRVVEAGTTEVVLRDPQHDYTRLLLDSVPRVGWNPAALGAARRRLAGAEESRASA